MGTVTDFRASHRAAGRSLGRFVTCAHCGERHPIVKPADRSLQCVTAFSVEAHWFCRNRGCRAAWLVRQAGDER
jgi:hypothetical protein